MAADIGKSTQPFIYGINQGFNMLTTVILDGVMGRRFGRKWNLKVNSPTDALKLIDANKPGVFVWIRSNLNTYESYRVKCTYDDGSTEYLDQDTYVMSRQAKTIRFTPIIEGAGGKGGSIASIILGIVLIVVAIFFPPAGAALVGGVWAAGALAGAALIVGGIIGLLTPMPKMGGIDLQTRNDKTSYYFDGPTNTTMQGVPVKLVYGECLVGSHPVSVSLTVDEIV